MRSKAERKYNKDWFTWTRYLLFNEVCNHNVQQIMINCGLAELLEEPVWMDRNGVGFQSEKDAF